MKPSTHDIPRPSNGNANPANGNANPANGNANPAETEADNLETMALFSSRIDSRTRCSREAPAEGSQMQECDTKSRPEAHEHRQ